MFGLFALIAAIGLSRFLRLLLLVGGIKVGITENAPSLYADATCMPADELGADAVPSASGSKNAGRVGIGDIVFPEAE